MLTVGVDLANKLGSWAGVGTLSGEYMLFIACTFCILLRKGAFTFFGVLVAMRVLLISLLPPPNSG